MRRSPIYQVIARAAQARKNCIKSSNEVWKIKWTEKLNEIEKLLPSGSGIDTDTKIDLDKTTSEKIVLKVSYHHMGEDGGYDGWTDHELIITPSFDGFNIRITGRNRNEIKDYLHELFSDALMIETNY